MTRLTEPKRTGGAGLVDPTAGISGSTVAKIVKRRGIRPAEAVVIHSDPGRMSLLQAVRYTFQVKTDVVLMICRSIADYFFAGLGTFAVLFATQQYHISEQQADLAVLALGIGAFAGLFTIGRIADVLLERGHLNARVWIGAAGISAASVTLLPAFFTDRLLLALPAITVSAFLLTGTGPLLDAMRVDVLVPRLRGRGESIREIFRTVAEGGAPFIFGLLSGVLAGGGPNGLRLAFLVTLPTLVLAAAILLIGCRTYGPDIASALASSQGDQETSA